MVGNVRESGVGIVKELASEIAEDDCAVAGHVGHLMAFVFEFD